MRVTIHNDGSATIREVWDITITNSSNTEWYVARHNLDNMSIHSLVVERVFNDGTITTFETLDSWNTNASRAEKAGRSGLLRARGGYEICWGFGELGRHKYIVTYTITNIVKGFDGADIMRFNFMSNAEGGIGSLNINIEASDFQMVHPQTQGRVFGFDGTFELVDGNVEISSRDRFSQRDSAAVLLVFAPGLLSPVDRRPYTLDEIISDSLEHTWWNVNPSQSSGLYFALFNFAIIVLFGSALIYAPTVIRKLLSAQEKSIREINRLAKDISYSREVPFDGNIIATYALLLDVRQIEKSAIVDSLLMKWVLKSQINISEMHNDIVIQLYPANPDMHSYERALYAMMESAADPSGALGSKSFKNWCRRNHSKLSSWFAKCLAYGKQELSQIGVYESVEFRVLFFTFDRLRITEIGREMALRILGFKQFLKSLAVIDEQLSPGTDLWHQYLVFAQLFGIAEHVVSSMLNSNMHFIDNSSMIGHEYWDRNEWDSLRRLTTRTGSFAYSMYSGYCSGSSSSSGGGSSGGGFSGGGGAGGR